VPKHVSVLEAAEALRAGDAVLLDVRERDEWSVVRAPDALHIPMRQLSTATHLLPTDKTLLCICHIGGRSAVVAEALVGAGYDAVNVAGGMEAWETAGLPVVSGPS
jgi:rhodanese-related sulfurtransferase